MARKKKSGVSKRTNAPAAATAVTPAGRIALIDALRGGAILMMLVYHFCFDLNHFGLLHQNFYRDPFWIAARSTIVGSFLMLAGISLGLATAGGIHWRAYGLRLGRIALCAMAVSLASYWMFPKSWVYFGVLHFMIVASVAALAFIRLSTANLVIGAALFIAGVTFTSPAFDHPWLNWIGLVTRKPVTEDYVPLLPWFGIVLAGMFAGKRIAQVKQSVAAWQWSPAGPAGRSLAWAGRHSLTIYMVHQPLLMGLLFALVRRG